MTQIASLRQVLAKQGGATDATQKEAVATTGSTTASDSQQSQESRTASQTFSSEEEPYKWGGYTPNFGYKVVNTEHGDLISAYTATPRYPEPVGARSDSIQTRSATQRVSNNARISSFRKCR